MSSEVAELRGRVREFIDEQVRPVEFSLLGPDHREALDDLMASAKEAGLWALGHPRELGGGGLSYLDYTYLNEVIGRSEAAEVALGTHTFDHALLLHDFGTPAQQDRWLGPLVAGEIFAGSAMTEPGVSGSDPKLMRTHAWESGDGWVLEGHKWFISWADRAEFVTVFAKTDPTADLHDQFSAFLVPTDTPGFVVERLLPIMGETDPHQGEIRLDGVRIPSELLLGARGDGFRIALHQLTPARVIGCMRWLGQAQRAFELMTAWANTRYTHGSRLRDKGEVERYIAESAVEIQAARLLTLDAAHRLDTDRDARVATSMDRFFAARMLQSVLDRAIQVHGAIGLTDDLPLEAMFRRARAARIADGPEEVHRMVVARLLCDDLAANAPWS